MKNNPIRLVVIVIASLLFLFSCVESDKSLGSQFVPDDILLKLKLDTLDLPITTRKVDSVQGSTNNAMLVGALHDNLFKTMTSSSAAQIRPMSDSTSFGIGPKLKNAYISFKIDSTVCYEESQYGIAQNIYVYRLLCDLDSTSMSNKAISPKDYDPDPISVGSSVHFGDDSLKIYLRSDFAQELLSTTKEEFDSTELFLKRIKGLYVTTDTPELVDKRGRLNYFSISNSYIYLNYVLNDPDRNIKDLDTIETFSIGGRYCLNNFSTGSDYLAGLEDDTRIYTESLSGVKPYINGKELKGIIDDWMMSKNLNPKKVVLSRATIRLPYELPEDYRVLDKEFPLNLYPCTRDLTDTTFAFSPLPDVNMTEFVGDINRSRQQYTADITSYLQKLIRADEKDVTAKDDLWLSQLSSFTDQQKNIYYSFDNTEYRKAVLNGCGAERAPKLEIAYVIVGRND